MTKLTASETLNYMIELLTSYLEECKEAKKTDQDRFAYGAKIAYTECLEIVQHWENACCSGLDFDVEERFPL